MNAGIISPAFFSSCPPSPSPQKKHIARFKEIYLISMLTDLNQDTLGGLQL